MDPLAQYMRPADLLRYREYAWSRELNRHGAEDWDALREEIEREGFRSPARLAYNHETGMAFLGEGNHRLAIAQELGRALPVVVYRSGKTAPGYLMKPLTPPGQYSMRDGLGFSRFPELASPSLIGLPTVIGERDLTPVTPDRPAPDRSGPPGRDPGIAAPSDSGAGLDF